MRLPITLQIHAGHTGHRHVDETIGLHKDRIMNWMEQNACDEKLLGRLDLDLLDQETVAHGDELTELVGRHDDRLVAMNERHGKLVEGRKRMVDVAVWADAKLDDVLAERSRLVCETWEWLQNVHAALVEREAVLNKAEGVIAALLTDLHERRRETVARLNKTMAKTKRECIEANPARGAGHFTDLLNSDDEMVAIDEQLAKLHSCIQWVVDRRIRAMIDRSTLLMRQQEEVFKRLVN